MAVSFEGDDVRQGVPENLENLVAPHIDSFDYFVERGLPEAVHLIRPVEVHDSFRKLKFYLWWENPSITKPFSEDGQHRPVYPSECRQAGTTYRGDFRIDLCVSYFDEDDDVALADVAKGPMQRQQLSLGRVPIMVKSGSCHLRHLTQEQLVRRKEESIELGGYFICNGIERLIRLLIAPRRNYVMNLRRPTLLKKGLNFSDMATTIRCVRTDQSAVTNRVVYVNDGNACFNFSLRKQEYFIPVGIILKCLVDVSDAELYEHLTAILTAQQAAADPPETDTQLAPTEGGAAEAATKPPAAAAAAGLGTQFVRERALVVLSHPRSLGLFTRIECLAFLGKTFRPAVNVPSYKPDAYVGQQIIADLVLVHLDKPMDKLRLLVFMLHKLWSMVDGLSQEDSMDTLMHHELYLPGHILNIFIKEKLQVHLHKIQAHAAQELVDNPTTTDLRASNWLRRLVEGGRPGAAGAAPAGGLSMTFIGKDIEYMLNTGNLASPSGLDMQQRSGFTVVADKLNWHRYLSHFRSVHRGAFFSTLRTTTVRKLLPEAGLAMTFIGKDIEYMLNTGNLASPSGLYMQQRSGLTVVADKLNWHRYLSHFRSMHRGAFFSTLRTTTVRKLLPESWGFVCPVHTPDGAPCGLLTHLSAPCTVAANLNPPSLFSTHPVSSHGRSWGFVCPVHTPDGAPCASGLGSGVGSVKSRDAIGRAVLRCLAPFGLAAVGAGVPPPAPPPVFLTVMLDGCLLGHIHSEMAPAAVKHLSSVGLVAVSLMVMVDGCVMGHIHSEMAPAGIPRDLEVAFIPFSQQGTFPGIFLFSAPARFVRPVRQLPSLNPRAAAAPTFELIGSLEQVSTGAGGHWGRWALGQVGTGAGGHWSRWALGQVGTGAGGHWSSSSSNENGMGARTTTLPCLFLSSPTFPLSLLYPVSPFPPTPFRLFSFIPLFLPSYQVFLDVLCPDAHREFQVDAKIPLPVLFLPHPFPAFLPRQVFLDVLCPDGSSAPSAPSGQASATGSATHEEVRPTDILSVMASLTPWSDYNQSPRNMYQCQMGKQTMGMPLHSFPFRNDNKLYRLQTPQTPIARTAAYDDYAMDHYPTGANAVVAVLAYTGYDMEDAMIINKSSMERGFGHGYIYKNEVIEATQGSAARVAKFTPSGLPVQMLGRAASHRRGHKWTIDTDGLPRPGEHITSGDVYACKVNTVTGKADEIKLKGSEDAVVDGVTLIGTGAKTALTKASVRMRFGRLPQIGDKFSSRHGQKGVLSQLWPDVDMPFASSSGIRPDIIINPHAFPSRMTIGMLVESVAAKGGALHGNFVDASPFRPATPNPPPLTMSLKSRQPAPRRGASRLARSSAGTPGLSTPVPRPKLHKKSGAPPTPATPVTPAAAGGAEKGPGSFTPLDLPTPASSAKPGLAAKPAAGPAAAGRAGESNQPQNREDLVDTFGRQLVEKGFSYYGTETMYSGVYGCEMECEIYLGVVYYQRLRHMVSDKFQVRSTGPVNPLTQQPVKGRKKGGGVRFGEMERDAMLSHGAAFLLHDRLHSCSDYHTTDVCSLCGSLLAPALSRPRGGSAGSDTAVALGLGLGAGVGYGTVGGELRQKKMVCRVCGTGKGVVRVAMPYVFKYLAAELAAMNIKLTLGV
ncbi:unnamed protein product [Closterium sp. NIES-65]|nr:unnamed protein product [Closterium sp. NIES-65]